MKCRECQRELLACDDPASQSLEVAAHLAQCLICQQWQQRLLALESNVSRLPVPTSRGAERVKRLLLNPSAATLPAAESVSATGRSSWRTAGLIAAGMAAAVLLTALGIQLGNMITRKAPHDDAIAERKPDAEPELLPIPDKFVPDEPERSKTEKPTSPNLMPQKSLAAAILELDLRLAQADVFQQRAAILAEVAGTLSVESKLFQQAGNAREAQTLAALHDTVVKEGLVEKDVPAEHPASLDPASRRLEYNRDAALIEAFVHGGVQMSHVDDPLQRARQCSDLASLLSKEIQQSTRKRDVFRATELGIMLHAVLVQGVAENLAAARSDLPADAVRSKEVASFADTVAGVTKSAEQAIEQLPPAEQEAMRPALEAMTNGREEVRQRSQGKGPPPIKGQGKGKKNRNF